jgi:hypothetical protein
MTKYNLHILDYIICIFLIIYLLYKFYIGYIGYINYNGYTRDTKLKNVSNTINTLNTLNRFENIPATTNAFAENAELAAINNMTSSANPTKPAKPCNGGVNLLTYCMNYNGCCSKTNVANNSCFCEHPFVMNCKNENDNCTGDDCQDKLKQCCSNYNNIDININNFKKPINQEQSSKLICTINSNNMEQKCMELCQTNTNCKAYSIDDYKCMLFSDIDPSDNTTQNNKINYFIKK